MKRATRAAAAILIAGALTLGAAAGPAAAIGGGYIPNPPKSPGMCLLAKILTPFDPIAIRRWC